MGWNKVSEKELPPLNIKETVEKLSSDEFIESKIKSVLE